MHVAVIGAGASGLATARNLLKIGCTLQVFERNEAIGGTWFYTDDVGLDKYGFPVYASMYSGLKTNLPKEVMGYSDFKFPEQENSYVTYEEVLSFLNSYADHFNLRPHIKLTTVVQEVRPLPNNRWSLKYLDLPTKKETVKEFDAVVVCSGHFNFESYPNIPGRDVFQGLQVHSHYYRKPDLFKGKKVLIIGAGPSGLEISVILSQHAESVILSHRITREMKSIFPPEVKVKIDVTRITETGAEFADGSSAELDCIIYCTGYVTKFPFLTDECKIVVEKDQYYIHPLYKHIINIEYPTMCIIGLPSQSCSLPLYDLQKIFEMLAVNNKIFNARQDVERRRRLNNFTQIRRNMRNESNPFLLDVLFIKLYRLSKNMVYDLMHNFIPYMSNSNHPNAISPEIRIFTALSFFSTGSYQKRQKLIGQSFKLSMSQQSVSKCVREVRYYMEYLKGSMKLPPKEKMYEETAAENERRKQMGLTNMHLNNADFSWDYYKDLADSAKIENTWRSIVQLRMDSAKNIVAGNLLTYRNDKYRIVDKDNYVKLN